MKIIVCVKETDGELSPFDQSAVECALELSDDVTVVTMGRKSAHDVLLRLTRLGCKAVLISDSAMAGADTLATAYALSLYIKEQAPELVICGRQSMDGDTAQTGPCLATMLDYSLATNVMELATLQNGLSLTTRMGESEVSFPALITVERIRSLRFPKLRSKIGEVTVLTANDLAADISKCGLRGSPTRVMKTFESKVGKRSCKFISPDELPEIIEAGRTARKELVAVKKSERLLPLVYCIGSEAAFAAESVAEKIEIIERDTAEKISEILKEKQPDFVLWPADLWGRAIAPCVQAMLGTGLCADCTALETDGEDLFMYRPAFGGTLTAKIRCITKPKMATVRLASQSDEDVIIGLGKGVSGHIEQMKNYAEQIGATLAASRGLVDTGAAPYSQQVGLTGRNIGSAVYIAAGISGAVHHTCVLDRVGTVIAINPDKKARIFEYADYGIVANAEDILK